jgi:isopentenyl phosphate kinase
MTWLCERLSDHFDIVSSVFLTDVPGVYDSPPTVSSSSSSSSSAQLLPEITIDDDGHASGRCDLDLETDAACAHDVTGGIKNKLRAAAKIAKTGCPCYIVKAGTKHAESALRGKRPEVGTQVLYSKKK